MFHTVVVFHLPSAAVADWSRWWTVGHVTKTPFPLRSVGLTVGVGKAFLPRICPSVLVTTVGPVYSPLLGQSLTAL